MSCIDRNAGKDRQINFKQLWTMREWSDDIIVWKGFAWPIEKK